MEYSREEWISIDFEIAEIVPDPDVSRRREIDSIIKGPLHCLPCRGDDPHVLQSSHIGNLVPDRHDGSEGPVKKCLDIFTALLELGPLKRSYYFCELVKDLVPGYRE
jgi:hypothetical protein